MQHDRNGPWKRHSIWLLKFKDLMVRSQDSESVPKELQLGRCQTVVINRSEGAQVSCSPWQSGRPQLEKIKVEKSKKMVIRQKEPNLNNSSETSFKINFTQSDSKRTGNDCPPAIGSSVNGTSSASPCSATVVWKTVSAWPSDFFASLRKAGETEGPASCTTAFAVLRDAAQEASANRMFSGLFTNKTKCVRSLSKTRHMAQPLHSAAHFWPVQKSCCSLLVNR